MAFGSDVNSLLGNSTDWMGYLQYINTESQGLFGLLFILSVWVVVFVSASMWRVGKAYTISSFTAFIVSVFLAVLGLVDQSVVVVLMLATIITAFLD